MKKLYLALLGVTLALLTAIGVWSLFGNGETVSAVDDKTLAEKDLAEDGANLQQAFKTYGAEESYTVIEKTV